MDLKRIYNPIKNELEEVEEIISASLKTSRHSSIRRINNYLLASPGKRIRPALLILSARAAHNGGLLSRRRLTELAAAMEIIHMASLIHDDIIDRANFRHHRPTVNSKCGLGISIALGDYLYSLAFGLIAGCENNDILECISLAVQMMCEGELLQVMERGNLYLSEPEYILIIKKKTATLFSACCEIGGIVSGAYNGLSKVLKSYGMNLGVAFQVVDDYLDIAGEGRRLGKDTGQDIRLGEATLPLLKLWRHIEPGERQELKKLFISGRKKYALERLRERFISSGAEPGVRKIISSFINSAQRDLDSLADSPYKKSLLNITDFFAKPGFN